ncbi:MAG: hypothetical protein JXR66_11925 [Bacteroidales bacterium]|nr:hypothetical protein [Bacteroidales bacterium]MBN2634259.1 hypothetical protein [Bacteroidales bacterium]
MAAFATEWLSKRTLFPQFITEEPAGDTGIIVVVPAFDEPDITVLLDSLLQCDRPACSVEIIIVINAPPGAGIRSVQNNMKCAAAIEKWKHDNVSCFFRLFYIDTGQPSIKDWGVGLARKTGMDEALRRFNATGNPDGIIVSLDADCTVGGNYFTAIFDAFSGHQERNACSVSFEHPLNGSGYSAVTYRYIVYYELHMRYFYRAMEFTGHPYVFHTIGSAIAFRASAYLKSGGMNRRQAGEDFYMVQKLIPSGGYFNLASTTVYPSPRVSDRVPFGTGATISKLINEDHEDLMTFNPHSFTGLKDLFSFAGSLYGSGEKHFSEIYDSLPPGLRSFLPADEWVAKMAEINQNTSSKEAFIKRFYGWFNMFRMVKYLNHVHRSMFAKVPVMEAAAELLLMTGNKPTQTDAVSLLHEYRSLEKKSDSLS